MMSDFFFFTYGPRVLKKQYGCTAMETRMNSCLIHRWYVLTTVLPSVYHWRPRYRARSSMTAKGKSQRRWHGQALPNMDWSTGNPPVRTPRHQSPAAPKTAADPPRDP